MQSDYPEMPPRVLNAFQIYMFNHNVTQTAKEVGVSRYTLHNWIKKYKWKEREAEALKRLQKDLEAYRRDVKADQRKIVKVIIAKAVPKIKSGEIDIDNIYELLAVLKYQLELEGERFDETRVEINAIFPLAELVSEIEDRRLKRSQESRKKGVEGRVND